MGVQFKPESGKLLISEPFMWDEHFRHTVLLLTAHDQEEGTVGFVINKPMDKRIETYLDDLGDFSAPLYYGGPVATNTLHYIHSVGDFLDDSVYISPGVYWGGDFEQLKALIRKELIKENQILFLLGYSGWTPGQLEAELQEKSWIMTECDANYVFHNPSQDVWKQILQNQSTHLSVLSQISTDSILN
ncbi:MAG TPA: YqgE/AlgH family protein [Saprospiraceae bacterium]|nr:YqgE/AlgH family protein [Saprospiraceae bacterium]